MFIPPPLSQAQPVHRQPISYPVTFATPHRVRRAQGACVRGRLCVSVCVCVLDEQLSCQDQSLSLKSCTICKKCNKKKNNIVFKAQSLVSTFPTFALY